VRIFDRQKLSLNNYDIFLFSVLAFRDEKIRVRIAGLAGKE